MILMDEPFKAMDEALKARILRVTADALGSAALLLITPFLLPLCVFCGYMQGPRLWARTEDAMKQGRRRAKARARVGKKTASKAEKPEI